jgi:hypothetical protein
MGPLGLTRFAYTHSGAPEQVIVDRVMSVSFIASLPQDQQDAVRARLREVIATDPALQGATWCRSRTAPKRTAANGSAGGGQMTVR